MNSRLPFSASRVTRPHPQPSVPAKQKFRKEEAISPKDRLGGKHKRAGSRALCVGQNVLEGLVQCKLRLLPIPHRFSGDPGPVAVLWGVS